MNEPTKDEPPPSRLSPEVLGRLRESLKLWASAESADESLLRPALHAVAAEARDRGVRAEELLVTLKTTWFEVAGGSVASHGTPAGKKRLDDLVTACIKAYYG